MIDTTNQISSVKPKGGIVAAYLGAIVTVMAIGVFQLIAHANKSFKSFLTINNGVGALSGKVIFGYLLGLAVFLMAYFVLKNKKDVNLALWTILFFIALLLGSLFTFTPFVELVA